ncbi:hypothetical protein [Streptomyces sp. NPDC058695]|uniref:hypothetical protein n=1 Tax=Streptomyces sp. NPDC058695 TaxID=3346604 RepID=UPI00365FFB31
MVWLRFEIPKGRHLGRSATSLGTGGLEGPCYSCHGHRFYYLPAVAKDDQGEAAEVVYLRHPCGCTEGSARLITGAPVEVTA